MNWRINGRFDDVLHLTVVWWCLMIRATTDPFRLIALPPSFCTLSSCLLSFLNMSCKLLLEWLERVGALHCHSETWKFDCLSFPTSPSCYNLHFFSIYPFRWDACLKYETEPSSSALYVPLSSQRVWNKPIFLIAFINRVHLSLFLTLQECTTIPFIPSPLEPKERRLAW